MSILRAALLLSTFSSPLPTDGDASANWRMAGMLSLGGIANRTTVCATLAPRGAGKDYTAAIQDAIDAQRDVEGLGRIWASRDYRVVWQKHDPPQQFLDDFDPDQYPSEAGSAGCWFPNCDRPTAEMHRIAAIAGNTITSIRPRRSPIA